MDVKWDPKLGGTPPPADATPAPGGPSTRAPAAAAATPEAMEKPRTLPLPGTAQIHPSRPSGATRPSSLELETDRLKAALHAGAKADRRRAGAQALALAGSSRFRRSRGARSLGLELCDAVAEATEEHAVLATRLKALLTAEGDLHETSAESTLRACRRLVELLDDDEAAS